MKAIVVMYYFLNNTPAEAVLKIIREDDTCEETAITVSPALKMMLAHLSGEPLNIRVDNVSIQYPVSLDAANLLKSMD